MFRDDRYFKRVYIGKRTVKEGECCVTWNLNGEHKTIEGPTRRWIFCSDVSFLKPFYADQHQYLVVKYKDASVEHIRGPKRMFLDPLHHNSITTRNAILLEESQALVVYTEYALGRPGHPSNQEQQAVTGEPVAVADEKSSLTASSSSSALSAIPEYPPTKPAHTPIADMAQHSYVTRRVISGPTVFVPTANDKIKNFQFKFKSKETTQAGAASFHGDGNDDNNNNNGNNDHGNNNGPGGGGGSSNPSCVLSLLEDHLMVDVSVVCQDQVPLEVQVIASYKIVDIERMVESTSDPSVVLRDMVEQSMVQLASKHDFASLQQLLVQPVVMDHVNFSTVTGTAHDIGLQVTRLAFKGYTMNKTMQQAFNAQLESKLLAQAKHDNFNNTMEMLKLEELEQASEVARQDADMKRRHQQQDLEEERRLKQIAAKQNQDLELADVGHKQAMQHAREQNEIKLEYLRGLSDIGVDMTRYMTMGGQKSSDMSDPSDPASNQKPPKTKLVTFSKALEATIQSVTSPPPPPPPPPSPQ
eukprot:CAMPEP_0197844956 /NCGR_PEP_ID=MMETSP1438-20131217/1919_1 /TAXON_ID=1461541 /ORGANISM="Pterosperma sp., Strain CCMP1384" /LENGTH=527 /DNA_ID=CAMNT_0043456003 /DNA_START=382 /DNA_END=1965 /DNA_ORIENTATION=+